MISTNDTTFRAPKGVRGRPWANLQKLAQDYSEEALLALASLVHCDNPCVQIGAIKMLFDRGYGRVPPTLPRQRGPKTGDGITVKITRFNEEHADERGEGHHDLPVVYGGWQGPRELERPGGSGMRPLRGKRAGVREQPEHGAGTPPRVPGPGAGAGHRRRKTAAGTDGGGAPDTGAPR